MPNNTPNPLVDGRIPAHTECPYVNICAFKKKSECKHLGVNHTVPFSCAAARLHRTIEEHEQK